MEIEKSAKANNTFVLACWYKVTQYSICVCMCMRTCRIVQVSDGVSTAAWNLKWKIAELV